MSIFTKDRICCGTCAYWQGRRELCTNGDSVRIISTGTQRCNKAGHTGACGEYYSCPDYVRWPMFR